MAAERPDGPKRPSGDPRDRRANVALRELLDEMIELARHLSHQAATMTPAELGYARERMEWLADEIWDVATKREDNG